MSGVRDVLAMLETELAQAREGTWKLVPDRNGVDVDLVEMFEETIEEIKRLRRAARPDEERTP